MSRPRSRPEEESRKVLTDSPDNRDTIEKPDSQMGAAYIRVVVIEIIVLLALWALSSTFSG